jgi:hypothetical protein
MPIKKKEKKLTNLLNLTTSYSYVHKHLLEALLSQKKKRTTIQKILY